MNMVEIVAHAQYDRWRDECADSIPEWAELEDRSQWLDDARTAILAIRDNVTPGMVEAGFEGSFPRAPEAVLRLMLNEALRESEA
jgi:hypothetical protein